MRVRSSGRDGVRDRTDVRVIVWVRVRVMDKDKFKDKVRGLRINSGSSSPVSE